MCDRWRKEIKFCFTERQTETDRDRSEWRKMYRKLSANIFTQPIEIFDILCPHSFIISLAGFLNRTLHEWRRTILWNCGNFPCNPRLVRLAIWWFCVLMSSYSIHKSRENRTNNRTQHSNCVLVWICSQIAHFKWRCFPHTWSHANICVFSSRNIFTVVPSCQFRLNELIGEKKDEVALFIYLWR